MWGNVPVAVVLRQPAYVRPAKEKRVARRAVTRPT